MWDVDLNNSWTDVDWWVRKIDLIVTGNYNVIEEFTLKLIRDFNNILLWSMIFLFFLLEVLLYSD